MPQTPDGRDMSILILDDDAAFAERLARAMAERDFRPVALGGVAEALDHVAETPPAFAVIDLRLRDGSGLDVLDALRAARPDARAIILTGYGDTPTVVAAVKLGAFDYLTKPEGADEIAAALLAPPEGRPEAPRNPITPNEVKRRHIERVFREAGGNISETARRLDMHRRTLQRIMRREAD